MQAAIAALHAQAPRFEDTDWPQIAVLYGELARRAPSPVVEINRAVAVGMADGPQAGLAILAPVLAAGTLAGYAPLHAAHADLLDRAGRHRGGHRGLGPGHRGHRQRPAPRRTGAPGREPGHGKTRQRYSGIAVESGLPPP